jgi:threonine dehydratase
MVDSKEIITVEEEKIQDPYCDEKHPKIITFHDVTSAAFKIKSGVEYTPCPVKF